MQSCIFLFFNFSYGFNERRSLKCLGNLVLIQIDPMDVWKCRSISST